VHKIKDVMRVIDPSGLTYYLGVIKPIQIMELTFVPCVKLENEDILNIRTQNGYQREGERKRMNQIAEFYSGHPQSIIPPVLLSTRGCWKFHPDQLGSISGTIEASDQVAIIDGQHRLGGLSVLAQDAESDTDLLHRNIPFVAVDFDDIKTESEEFETINGKQKGIKPSHLMYIRRGETFWGNAAYMLQNDSDSVFAGRIAIATRSDADLITFKAAQEIVALTFDNLFCQNAFRPDEEENQLKAMSVLQNYWKLVSQVFQTMWSDINSLPRPGEKKLASQGRSKFEYRLLEETGLRAFGRLGSNILLKSWIPASQEIAWQTVEDYLRKVSSDPVVELVLQKLKPHNREEILSKDARLIQQGLAGEKTLYSFLYGALERNG
jgi:DGQHR domain-containing protein